MFTSRTMNNKYRQAVAWNGQAPAVRINSSQHINVLPTMHTDTVHQNVHKMLGYGVNLQRTRC